MKSVYILASDSLEGRETGMPGQKKSAAYLASKYESFSLSPAVNKQFSISLNNSSVGSNYSYFQNHPIRLKSNKGRNLSVNGIEFLFGKDFIYANNPVDTALFFVDFTFMSANEINVDSTAFRNGKLSGKNLLLYNSNPESLFRFQNIPGNLSSEYPNSAFIITSENNIGSLLINNECGSANNHFPVIYITEEVATNFFSPDENKKITRAIKKKKKRISKLIKCQASLTLLHDTEILIGQNVIALIKGTDADSETVIISSHYDHLGKKDSLIYFGADDNASGTSAVLEMARIFSLAKHNGDGPRRNIIFMNLSGEEKGLLGSAWYVANPVIPLKSTVADLNIDMIGRIDPFHDSTGVADYIYIIGDDKLSDDLHQISETENLNGPALELNYRFNDPDEPNHYYTRSDHYNFAKNDIPIIFYFDGSHADYHKPSDTADKINFELLTKRTQLVFQTAWRLANSPERIRLNHSNK